MYKIVFQNDPKTQKSVKVMTPIVSEADYRAERDSAHNLAVLGKVHEKYHHYLRQISNGADTQTLKQLKDDVDAEKARLVQFNYSCVPDDSMLLRGCTQVTPWVGMDVDFNPSDPEFEQKREEAPQRIISMADQLGLGMFERSAGKGYHIVFRRHLDLSQEENLRWASNLIGCQYDENAKDITRVFFTTSASADDLLYLSPEMFAPEANQPVEVKAEQTISAPSTNFVTTTTAAVAHTTTTIATPNPSAHFYQDISFSDILAKYNELFNNGKEPTFEDHNRNTWTFEWAQSVRCIRDFNVERVMEVTPIYGDFPQDEWRQCIENACNQPRKGMTYRMRKVLEALRKEGHSSMPWGLTSARPPKLLSRMPEPLRKIAALAPEFLKTTVSEGSFGALSTHLHGVTFESIDGKICEPAMMQIIISRFSSGKGCVDIPIECINEDLKLHDDADRLREDDWKQNNPSGATKKAPFPADIYIQICQSDMTHAGFVKRLLQCHRNGGRPIFVYMVELDEITAISTNGKCDVTRVIRKAFDRSSYGQERAGSDSVSGEAPCRFNFTAATTPLRATSMCSSWAADGTLSRNNLLTIDPNDNDEKIKYKPCTQRYKDSIRPYIERLNNASGLIRCKKAYQLAERLRDQLEDAYASTDSDVIKSFAPRAVTIAYWKAMILYIMAGQKWSKDIEAYVEWSLKRDLWVKLQFFGKKLQDDLEKENNLETYHPKNILEVLPEQFNEEEFCKARTKLGLNGNYKEHLKKLKQRRQVEYDDISNMYIKIAKDNA